MNIYKFAELYLNIKKNSECLINRLIYIHSYIFEYIDEINSWHGRAEPVRSSIASTMVLNLFLAADLSTFDNFIADS